MSKGLDLYSLLILVIIMSIILTYEYLFVCFIAHTMNTDFEFCPAVKVFRRLSKECKSTRQLLHCGRFRVYGV